MKIENLKSNKTLLELLIGILAWGIICQAAGMWLVKDKGGYSLGLWIGVFMALASAVHMWWGLDKMLSYSDGSAAKRMLANNILRYLLIAAALGVIMVSGTANPFSAFLALMGLKISAYIQPLIHKLCVRFYHDGTAK